MPTLAELYLAHPFWIWMAAGGALLALEVATGSGWLLWPAASAAVTAVVVTFAHIDFPWAVLLFAILTIATALPARRYLPRSLTTHSHDVNDNIGRLVGHQGQAVASFRDRSGRVFIDGKEWAAELEDGEALEAGSRVEVTGVHGARLRVRAA